MSEKVCVSMQENHVVLQEKLIAPKRKRIWHNIAPHCTYVCAYGMHICSYVTACSRGVGLGWLARLRL